MPQLSENAGTEWKIIQREDISDSELHISIGRGYYTSRISSYTIKSEITGEVTDLNC